jgi:hypothetical protein
MKIWQNMFEIIIEGEGEIIGGLNVSGYVFVTVKNCFIKPTHGIISFANDDLPPSETFETIQKNQCAICHNHGVTYSTVEYDYSMDEEIIIRFMTNSGRQICPNCSKIMSN